MKVVYHDSISKKPSILKSSISKKPSISGVASLRFQMAYGMSIQGYLNINIVHPSPDKVHAFQLRLVYTGMYRDCAGESGSLALAG